ncbi:hypothetical protein [Roseovarius sp.]|uniref:hypothetical protein n=1 Tax=Roseovarius sp. TaxID=1486281 RepID=UPI003BAC4F36
MNTYQRDEEEPETYPAVPADLNNAGLAWSRIEEWISWRWSEREVNWTVEGAGWWAPDLKPVTITATEKWQDLTWQAVTLDPSPLGGYVLDGETYRFTATVGADADDVPAAVQEAVTRLDAYMAEAAERHGAGRYEVSIGGLSESFDRNPTWRARALHLSGAADLLRKYRRAP